MPPGRARRAAGRRRRRRPTAAPEPAGRRRAALARRRPARAHRALRRRADASTSWPRSRAGAGWTSSRSPTTTRSATTPTWPPAGARAGVALLPGQEVTTDRGHANAFGDIGWVDFRRPADDWLVETERARRAAVGQPPAGRRLRLAAAAGRAGRGWPRSGTRSWLGPHLGRRRWPGGWPGTRTPIPIGGSDFHRPGADAPPGAPTTWVACERSQVDGGDPAGAVLDGLRAGRVAVSAGSAAGSAGSAGPVLLRLGDDLVAVGAAGLLVSGPDGRRIPIRGDRVSIPAGPGPRWLEDHDTAILALTA